MNRPRPQPKRVGEIRPSQILTYYGIGAVVDLPSISTIIMGLDEWEQHSCIPIAEERLLAHIQTLLGTQIAALKAPPLPDENNDPTSFDGIPVNIFPRWLVCPRCRLLSPLNSGLFQLKHTPSRPDTTRYVHATCTVGKQPPTVLPARFVAACEKGHLDDFPWSYFVHRGKACPTGVPSLRLREIGVTGEATDVIVTCERCTTSRTMAQAFGKTGEMSLPLCRGRHPHLHEFTTCELQLRTILLGATNSWFSVIESALSLPTSIDPLRQLVDRHWSVLTNLTSEREVALTRNAGGLKPFRDYTDEQIFATIAEVRHEADDLPPIQVPLKVPEWHAFTNPTTTPQDADFRLKQVDVPTPYRAIFDRIVLVERLREVRALVGFSRLTTLGESTDLAANRDMLAPLARKAPTWVPASEVHGEGIFLHFNESLLARWEQHVIHESTRDRDFAQAHAAWCQNRHISAGQIVYPSLRYVLLHSFSHVLMRQLALESGYTSASLSERIYSLPVTDEYGPMSGMLISTAANDSEGTLGGLVRLGRPNELERHIKAALDSLIWCSSDPLCAEHQPDPSGTALHGAACHACLFAPETACERGNRFLDRTLLMPTLHIETLAFFPFALPPLA